MPRYNVYNRKTDKWRCFSTIVDDFITEWMDIATYEKWRKEQYGVNCGLLSEANQMSPEEAEEIIKMRESEREEE